MKQETIELVAKQLIESGLAQARDIKGCSDDEIAQIEAVYQVRLPSTYKAFLAGFGKGAGHFLEGSDFLFPAVLNLRSEAERLLITSHGPFRLTRNHFVFVMHQGYEFLFLDTEFDNDPAVFLFTDGDEQPQQVYQRFSEWLMACVADEISAYRDLN
jgi:hypothetical protein